jgi:hypothetical protein
MREHRQPPSGSRRPGADQPRRPSDQEPLEVAAYWAEEVRAATAARDEAIATALAAGIGQRQLARATGLSHPGIAKIAARQSTAGE